MLLIHTCCADCVLKFIKSAENELDLKNEEIALYYYNPNIHPRTEYLSRMEALKQVMKNKDIKLIFPNWRPVEYFERIKKLKQEKPETDVFDKKIRCPYCWNLRLEASFKYAKEKGFTKVSSTLVTSQYQNKEAITEIGEKLAKKYGIDFYVPKKIECELKTRGFYKQNYCGCVYSLLNRMEEKFL